MFSLYTDHCPGINQEIHLKSRFYKHLYGLISIHRYVGLLFAVKACRFSQEDRNATDITLVWWDPGINTSHTSKEFFIFHEDI